MSNKNGDVGLGAIIISLFQLLMNFLLLFYFIMFLRWYIKGLFGKHFIWFWAATIIGFFIVKYDHDKADREYQEYWDKYGSRSAYELWEEGVKSGESYNK